MQFVAVKKSYGVGVASLAERGDESCGTLAAADVLVLGRGIKGVRETRYDKIPERGLALGRHNLGAVQDFLRKVDGGFHKQYLQVCGDIVKY
jgi:hypothetical protein